VWLAGPVTGTDVLVGVAILVGLCGIVVPLLPGTLLVGAAILVWAAELGTRASWVVAAVACTFLVGGTVVRYVVPHRRLKEAGVPSRSLVVGGLVGVVGFFVLPVVGLFLGFVLGIYLSEVQRLGPERARASTKAALLAVGISQLIELAAALLATTTWLVAVVVG
jgi:uncharacterized protein YqgC (DUF456 family)